jgi:hypothetical protein
MAIDPSKLVGVGTTANDNTGDPLRDAFVKINDNFTELYIEPSISLVGNILTLTRPDDSTSTVDLAPYLDEDARAIASGTIDGAGIVTFTRDDATTFTLDLSSLRDDTNLITSVDGGTGLEVDTTTGDVTVSVSDNGIDHQQLSNSYTALSDLGTGSSFAIDFDSASTFTATANATATLTMSNAQQGQVVDIIMGVGDFAITLAETGSTFNKVGSTNYDGTTNNVIQIICTDDTSGSKIYHYAVAPFTSSTTV